ncbi:MAG TPA: hypothetical protein VH331_18890 [Allosphingosinicella sp.]|jgi:hypothetical protein|nr:hypothetical protein [Allosphingosinicella sp.]
MATYFFHLRDGVDLLLDAEGRILDGDAEIAAAALTEARAILSADILTGWVNLDQRIEVEDGEGALIHRLRFEDAFEFTREDKGRGIG